MTDVQKPTELTRAMTLILMVLTKGIRHGYAIMTGIADMTDDDYWVAPGTLYRSLAALVDANLIEEMNMLGERDRRRRQYRITWKGLAAVEIEIQRMEKLVLVARESIRP